MSLETIVLGGGGARGFAYLGIIKYIEKYNKYSKIKRVIGSSIGSLFSVMIAQKRSYAEIRSMMRDHPLVKVDDKLSIANLCSIMSNNYIYERKDMEDLIRVLCNEDETFGELFKRTKIHLTIVASNITKHCSDFFNKDSHPNMPIYIACLASTAYPLVFSPVLYEENLYVDGGMTYNVPTDYYKGNGVCFILEDKKIENNDKEDSNGLFSFLKSLYKTLLNA